MTETENKAKVKNRAWVKNAAIVFLAVLLVLTFFSNTIMNYSLPVVSAQYPMSGTISAKIRGQGTVASNQSFNVTVDETREIKTVAVKKGDTVSEGQILFILEDKESDELSTAEKALDQLLYDYEVFLLGLAASSPEVNTAQNTLSDAITAQNKASTDQTTAKSDLSAAKAELESAQKEYDAAKAVLDAAQATYDLASTSKANTDLALSQAKAALTLAEGDLTEEEKTLRGPLTQAEKDLEAANLAATNAKTNLDFYEGLYGSYSTALSTMDAQETIMDGLDDKISRKIIQIRNFELTGETYEEIKASEATLAGLKEELDTLEAQYRAAEILYDDAYDVTRNSSLRSAISDYEDAIEWVNDATNTVYIETTNYNKLSPTKSVEVDTAKKAVTKAESEVTKAEVSLLAAETALSTAKNKAASPETRLSEAKTEMDKAESAVSDDLDTHTKAVRDARQSLEYALENLQTSDAKNSLELEKKKAEIAKQEEDVEKLTKDAAPLEITAKFAGVITALNVVSGDKTEYGATLATIEVVDKGYTLELSVAADQAAKVVIGDKAEITNLWRGDTTATLAQVVSDPESAGKNRILRFVIEGSEIVTGQTLSLSIGQRSQNYDSIIPNSAVREDSNGKYVYTVETKSSPLSNRYIATRIDVTVLASDDTNSAVNGFTGGEFVIVSSTAPITAGMQVRMSDG